MKALVLESIGRLSYRDVPTPVPKAGEVLLQIKACGICSSDFDRCLKTGTYHFPTIPGHEFSGKVVAVGSGVEKSLIGKRATVFPLLPCNKCDQCRIEAFARCRNYNYFGSRCDGAFAEFIAVPVWNVQVFNDSIDYKVAALCEPAAVAYHSISAIDAQYSGEICIVGTGTIGILAGLIARDCGRNVTFISRNIRKTTFLKSLGFDSCIGYGENLDRSFGAVIECVGTNDSLIEAVARVSVAGRIILVGNPDADKMLPRKTYWKILRDEITIKGVWNSNYSSIENDWGKVLNILQKRQEIFSRLVTSTYPLSTGIAVFDSIKKSSHLEIKGMFINE